MSADDGHTCVCTWPRAALALEFWTHVICLKLWAPTYKIEAMLVPPDKYVERKELDGHCKLFHAQGALGNIAATSAVSAVYLIKLPLLASSVSKLENVGAKWTSQREIWGVLS